MSGRDDGGSNRVLPFTGGAGTAPIAGGGGGPHDPGMDARVTRLEEQYGRIETLLRAIDDRVGRIEDRVGRIEDHVGRIEDRVGRLDDRLRHIEIDVAELKGRIVNLPTTWAMITTMIGGQIALAGILLAAFRFAGLH